MATKYNTENLIPNSQRTHEELVEMGRRGGLASAAARKAKKLRREQIADMVELTRDWTYEEKAAVLFYDLRNPEKSP